MSEHAVLTVDGTPIEVTGVEGEEGVSRLFRFSIVGGSEVGAVDVSTWPGIEATLTLLDGHRTQRVIQGIVAEASAMVQDEGTLIVSVELAPRAQLSTLGRDCRCFLEQDIRQIVDAVLGDLPHRWELSGSYAMRPYTVQYREDDWTFICRLLEQEGIYYWFDHSADSILVLADDSRAAPDLVGGPLVEFFDETGMTRDQEVIEELGETAGMQPGRFTVRSFNPLMPALEVSGSVPGEGVGNGGLEYYDAPGGGPTSPQEATRQAQLGSQASAASHAGVFGKASSGRIEPARTLRVAGHPVTRFDRGFFVTRVRTRIVQRRRDQATSDERPFTCWFDAIVDDMPFRPPRITPPAQQAGLQSGMVVGPPGEEIHTDEQGSVRVRLHWDRQGTDGWWMRVAQRGAADSLQLPRIGWNVLTFNDEGAADAPSVLARILDAEHPPPYALPENKTRVVFKTATSPGGGSFNEIYFEDTKGAEQMFINASKDMKVFAQQAKVEGVNNDSTHTIGNNHSLTVKRNRNETIERNQSVSIGGDEKLEGAYGFAQTVGGDVMTTVAGNRKLDVGDAHTITVENSRSMSVGSAIIDISLGDITAQAKNVNLTIGGAQLKVAAQTVSQETGGVGVFTVGAAKLQFIKEDRALDVSKQYIESVGGLLMCKSAAKYTDNAGISQTWNVGGAIKASAPEVKIEATEMVEIVCGASSITLYPDSVELRSTNLDLGEASDIEVKTAIIKHN